jgi:hypothetical protein
MVEVETLINYKYLKRICSQNSHGHEFQIILRIITIKLLLIPKKEHG